MQLLFTNKYKFNLIFSGITCSHAVSDVLWKKVLILFFSKQLYRRLKLLNNLQMKKKLSLLEERRSTVYFNKALSLFMLVSIIYVGVVVALNSTYIRFSSLSLLFAYKSLLLFWFYTSRACIMKRLVPDTYVITPVCSYCLMHISIVQYELN